MTPLARHTYSVLVVDDDAAVLECYRRILERAGYRARVESDPVKVLQANGELSDVDLIVLDYKMPGMDGLTLLAELRHREFRARCVLISAYLNDAVRQQAELLGVDLILQKPVDVGALRAAIAELLPTTTVNRARASH